MANLPSSGRFPRFLSSFAVVALVVATVSGCGGQAAGTTSMDNSGPPDLEQCTNLGDEQAAPVKVVIANHTSQALYVGPGPQTCYGSFNSQPFAVGDEAGLAVGSGRACGNLSCGELAKGNTSVGCTNLCIDYAEFNLLQPGESLKTSWSPERLARYELPPKCLKSSELALTCTRAERVTLGTTLTFGAQGSSELDCSGLSNGCGTCQAASLGGCSVQAKGLTGAVLQATSTIALDEEYVTAGPDSRVVELAFVE